MNVKYLAGVLMACAAMSAQTASAEVTYNLPFSFEPSSATIQECEVIDVNGDGKGSSGIWTINDGAFRYTYSSDDKIGGDDWVILPMVNFGTNKKVTVSFDVKAGGYDEKFEVWLGQERTVEGMTVEVLTDTYKDSSWKTVSAEVELPETDVNEWALGFHACSAANMNTLDIKNIRIEGEEGEVEPPVSGDYVLPFSFAASPETFAQCINIDANDDRDPNDTMGYNNGVWSFATAYGGAFKYTYNANNDADDWLILPLVDFGDTKNVMVSVDVRTATDPENFEVYLGQERTVEGMTVEVLSRSDYTNSTSWETMTAQINLNSNLRSETEAGNKWCVGIHATSPAFRYALYVNNISIKANPLSGIENEFEEIDGDVEYYTLQGLRIAEPQPGQTVIVRKNGKATKRIFN